jgi:hypothetical protein
LLFFDFWEEGFDVSGDSRRIGDGLLIKNKPTNDRILNASPIKPIKSMLNQNGSLIN